MVTPSDVSTVDLAGLTRVPVLTTEGYVSLLQSLIAVSPEDPPQMVARARQQLEALLARTQAALVTRLGSEADLGLERAFDLVVDRLWSGIRELLELWLVFRHEGLELLDEDEQQKAELEAGRELAAVADALLERLFPGGKTEFLRRPYHEQVVEMSSRLHYIESQGLQDQFIELVGPRLVALLGVCQRRYAAMVHQRAIRDGSSVPNLRELRLEIVRNIGIYNGVIAGLLYSDMDDAAAVVERALMPNLLFQARRSAEGGSEDELEDQAEAAGEGPAEAGGPDADLPGPPTPEDDAIPTE